MWFSDNKKDEQSEDEVNIQYDNIMLIEIQYNIINIS